MRRSRLVGKVEAVTSDVRASSWVVLGVLIGSLWFAGSGPFVGAGAPAEAPLRGSSDGPFSGHSIPASPHVNSETTRPFSSPQSTSWGWWNVTASSSTVLPPIWFTEGTWDAADGYVLTYGGDNNAGTTYNQT